MCPAVCELQQDRMSDQTCEVYVLRCIGAFLSSQTARQIVERQPYSKSVPQLDRIDVKGLGDQSQSFPSVSEVKGLRSGCGILICLG